MRWASPGETQGYVAILKQPHGLFELCDCQDIPWALNICTESQEWGLSLLGATDSSNGEGGRRFGLAQQTLSPHTSPCLGHRTRKLTSLSP